MKTWQRSAGRSNGYPIIYSIGIPMYSHSESMEVTIGPLPRPQPSRRPPTPRQYQSLHTHPIEPPVTPLAHSPTRTFTKWPFPSNGPFGSETSFWAHFWLKSRSKEGHSEDHQTSPMTTSHAHYEYEWTVWYSQRVPWNVKGYDMISGGCSNMEVWPQFVAEPLFVVWCGVVLLWSVNVYLLEGVCACCSPSGRTDM